MASITVNGNTTEPARAAGAAWTLSSNDAALSLASDASKSNFILIQVYHVLSIDEKQILEDKHVLIQEYVAENTYLCRYEPTDLQTLRSFPFVRTADV
jgi:serine protease AprX